MERQILDEHIPTEGELIVKKFDEKMKKLNALFFLIASVIGALVAILLGDYMEFDFCQAITIVPVAAISFTSAWRIYKALWKLYFSF